MSRQPTEKARFVPCALSGLIDTFLLLPFPWAWSILGQWNRPVLLLLSSPFVGQDGWLEVTGPSESDLKILSSCEFLLFPLLVPYISFRMFCICRWSVCVRCRQVRPLVWKRLSQWEAGEAWEDFIFLFVLRFCCCSCLERVCNTYKNIKLSSKRKPVFVHSFFFCFPLVFNHSLKSFLVGSFSC